MEDKVPLLSGSKSVDFGAIARAVKESKASLPDSSNRDGSPTRPKSTDAKTSELLKN
jgi:hypothetical protein